MKRTTTRRKREMQHFMADNRRLFPFAVLFLVGVGVGVAVFLTAGDSLPASLLAPAPSETAGFLHGLWDACFSTAVLLGGLYLLGLWACGVPFILAVPLIHGVGLGLTEAYCYRTGIQGVVTVAARVMPVGLLGAAVLTAACAESLRLSTRLSRHLLTAQADEDVGSGFRLYSLRFLLFFAAAVAVAVIEVLLRRVV